jgi:hypothetical protein
VCIEDWDDFLEIVTRSMVLPVAPCSLRISAALFEYLGVSGFHGGGALSRIVAAHGAPTAICCGQGTEFTAEALGDEEFGDLSSNLAKYARCLVCGFTMLSARADGLDR